jgi:UDP-glucose 4-epimerase
MSDKILITGGLGYLGGCFGVYFSKHTDLYPILTTTKKHFSDLNLEQGKILTVDPLPFDDVERLCKDVRYVVHLASLSESESSSEPDKAVQVNTLGALKVLQAAERTGVERFIYFSTLQIYGANAVANIDETTIPRPLNPYAITHRAAEDFMLASHRKRIPNCIVVRLSNSIGCPAHKEINQWHLIGNDLCRQAVGTGQLKLRSAGLQWRDFISLQDVCRAAWHLLQSDDRQIGDGLFNLGGENPMRIIDVANLVADRCLQTLGFKPPIIRPVEQETNLPKKFTYSIEKLKGTGFNLTSDINRGIDDTLAFCKSL